MIPHTFNMMISYSKVGWNSRLLAWFEEKPNIREEEQQTCLLRKHYIFSQKEYFMHLLLFLNEDFDDDFIKDSLELLVPK